MQGSSISGTNQKRAGNLFYDRDLPSNSLRHIKSSFEFTYNAADDPSEAVPEYSSTSITVSTFDNNNAESCAGGELVLVLCNNEPCIYDELTYLLTIAQDLDSLIAIKQAILNHLVANQNYTQAVSFLEAWNVDQANLENLFEVLLGLEEYGLATTVFESFSVIDQRDQDYYDFYSIILNQMNEEIPADSLTSTDMLILLDIADRTNDVADLVKAYLNYFALGNYPMSPEEWEGENLRLIKNNYTENKPAPKLTEKKFEFSVFPNPANESLNVFINAASNAYVYSIEIINPLGQKVLMPSSIIANTKVGIDVSTLSTGVYYINIFSSNGEKSVKRISILR